MSWQDRRENSCSPAQRLKALPEVSQVRLEQTLFAEYPELKVWLEKLKGAKTLQTPTTLASVWGIPEEEATLRASTGRGWLLREARGRTIP